MSAGVRQRVRRSLSLLAPCGRVAVGEGFVRLVAPNPPPLHKVERENVTFTLSSRCRAASALWQEEHLDGSYDSRRAITFVVSLSGLLALLTLAAVGLMPHLLTTNSSPAASVSLAALWIGSLALVLGYGCAYFDGVLRTALAGGATGIHGSDLNLRSAATCLARWSLCFLAGPAVLISLAIRHVWLCTTVTLFDVLLVANLMVCAVSYWVIELIALNGVSQFVPPAPQQVLNVARQLKWRAYLAGLAACTAGVVYAALGASLIWLLRGPWAIGLVLSWLWWFSACECSAFVLRTVGFWHYRSRTTTASSSEQHPAL